MSAMIKTKTKRCRSWALAGAWTLLIYFSLSMVRLVSDILKELLPYALCMNAFMALILLGILIYALMVVKVRQAADFVMIAIVLGCYVVGLVVIESPDEKVHFLQYGILAFLIFKALRLDCSRLTAYIGAFIIASCLGWGDEVIQGLLPNRYYDLRDVGLNSISAALGLLLTFSLKREKVFIRP